MTPRFYSMAELRERIDGLRAAITEAHDAGQYERRNALCKEHDDLALARFHREEPSNREAG